MKSCYTNSWLKVYPPHLFEQIPSNLDKLLTFTNNICIVLQADKGDRKLSLDILSSCNKKLFEYRQIGFEFQCSKKFN